MALGEPIPLFHILNELYRVSSDIRHETQVSARRLRED